MTQEELEHGIINLMLAGDEPYFAQLREQFLHSTVDNRWFSGIGFFTHYTIPDELAIGNLYGVIDDVDAWYDNDKGMDTFNLFISDGKISTLEGFEFKGGDWCYDYSDISIRYSFKDRRRYELVDKPRE